MDTAGHPHPPPETLQTGDVSGFIGSFDLVLVTKQTFFFFCGNVSSGRGSTSEDAEHGEVPTHRHGHGTPHSEAEPEQLESSLPLVAMETPLRDGA